MSTRKSGLTSVKTFNSSEYINALANGDSLSSRWAGRAMLFRQEIRADEKNKNIQDESKKVNYCL